MRLTIEFDHGEERDATIALNAPKYLIALQAFAKHLRAQIKHVDPENREDVYGLHKNFYDILASAGVEILE